jgi:hypothetical protein
MNQNHKKERNSIKFCGIFLALFGIFFPGLMLKNSDFIRYSLLPIFVLINTLFLVLRIILKNQKRQTYLSFFNLFSTLFFVSLIRSPQDIFFCSLIFLGWGLVLWVVLKYR